VYNVALTTIYHEAACTTQKVSLIFKDG